MGGLTGGLVAAGRVRRCDVYDPTNEDTTFTRARARIRSPGAMRTLHVRVCAAACLQMRIRIYIDVRSLWVCTRVFIYSGA